MKLNIKKTSEESEEKLGSYFLSRVTVLDGAKENPTTKMLASEYREVRNADWVTKASLSVMNALITQNKVVFILTRESLRKLLKRDINHKSEVMFKNENYKHFIAHISQLMFKITKIKRKEREVMVCEAKLPALLKLVKVDKDVQMAQVKLFITGEVQEATESEIEIAIKAIIARHSRKNTNVNVKLDTFGAKSKIEAIVSRYKALSVAGE